MLGTWVHEICFYPHLLHFEERIDYMKIEITENGIYYRSADALVLLTTEEDEYLAALANKLKIRKEKHDEYSAYLKEQSKKATKAFNEFI